MTSGGSESNIAAVLASVTYMREKRGITQPEIIIGETAHASFWKAAKFMRAKCAPHPCGYAIFTMSMPDCCQTVLVVYAIKNMLGCIARR